MSRAVPAGPGVVGSGSFGSGRSPCASLGAVFEPFADEFDLDLRSGDPLGFPGYAASNRPAGESVRTGVVGTERGTVHVRIEGDFSVLGGSMGVVHGEKVVRAFDRATAHRLPVVVVTRSGGARMQEGMVALVQLARTAAAVGRHRAAGLLSVSVHLSPTTGGVFASYGSLTDLRVVEAGAVIGFGGPRVVEQVTGVPLDGTSHSGETAAEHHLVDAVLPSDELAGWVSAALGQQDRPLRPHQPPTPIRPPVADPDAPPAWREVLAARRMGRASGIQVAAAACSSWVELAEGTDPSLRTALAVIDGREVVAVAFDRYGGRGQPGPHGFALARRGIELADRLGRPVVTFVDTPGADPSPASENAGIALEIARTHAAMAMAAVPTVSICVGEGGSGGALALAWADRLLIQEHAIFSVIGPEGAAAILVRDAGRAPEVAERLRLTSADLLALGVVDEVVPDDLDGAVAALHAAVAAVTVEDGPDPEGRRRRRRADQLSARWLS